MKTYADGQLAASATSIFIAGQDGNYPSVGDINGSLTLTNTSAVNTETIVLTFKRQGGTSRRLLRLVLSPNEAAIVRGIPMQQGDQLLGSTTDATTVDYVLGDSAGGVGLTVESYDSNGVLKQTNGVSITGATTLTSTSATALAVGANGTTNPCLQVDDSTASVATGVKIKGAAAGSGVAISALSSGSNETLTIDGKGTSGVTICGTTTSTGPIQFGGAGSGNNATGIKITPAAAASGVAIVVVSTGTNEGVTFDAKGSGQIEIGGTSTGQVFLAKGALKALVVGQTLTSIGTAQSSTPTAAQLLGGLITQTSSTGAGTITLPTGTALSAACSRTPVTGDSFDCMYANLGGGQTLTVTGATGTTVQGGATIATAKTAKLTFVCTGANAWNIYTTGG